MNKLTWCLFLSFILLFVYFFSPIAFAQSVQSNCVVTKVGSPGSQPSLPPGCGTDSTTVVTGKVPLYKQWDPRWGGNSYGCGSTIAEAGCGPTSLAMVMSYYTGRIILPSETAAVSISKGWRLCGNGTAWAAMTGMPALPQYGLKSKAVSWAEAKKYLAQGLPIIQSQSNGYFTHGGHFIVITGMSADGKTFYINDPDGFHRTQATEPLITVSMAAQWYISK